MPLAPVCAAHGPAAARWVLTGAPAGALVGEEIERGDCSPAPAGGARVVAHSVRSSQ
jgi:hypothetical protein